MAPVTNKKRKKDLGKFPPNDSRNAKSPGLRTLCSHCRCVGRLQRYAENCMFLLGKVQRLYSFACVTALAYALFMWAVYHFLRRCGYRMYSPKEENGSRNVSNKSLS